MSASTDLTFALYHAIAYLTRSLIGRYSATTIDLLHFTLERNLAKQYENNWFPTDPQRGSGRRCLSLSPTCAPPRPIYYACKSARVNWEDWMTCLGGMEMDLFIDPGCVSVRFGKLGAAGIGRLFVVWSAKAGKVSTDTTPVLKQTVAQSIIDDDEEELFNMIADEIRAPTWMTPILNQFPTVPRPTITIASPPKSIVAKANDPASATSTASHSSMLSVASRHSRSSSRSSDSSSSGFSFSSTDSIATVATSVSASSRPISRSNSSRAAAKSFLLPAAALIMQAPSFDEDDDVEEIATPAANGQPSRRERVRQTRVLVDSTKKEVTPYDGGKTTVLTGGVMLGMKAPSMTPPSVPAPASPASPGFGRKTAWRNVAARVTPPRPRA